MGGKPRHPREATDRFAATSRAVTAGKESRSQGLIRFSSRRTGCRRGCERERVEPNVTFMPGGRGKRCDLRCSNYRAAIDTRFCSSRIGPRSSTRRPRRLCVATQPSFVSRSNLPLQPSIILEVSAENRVNRSPSLLCLSSSRCDIVSKLEEERTANRASFRFHSSQLNLRHFIDRFSGTRIGSRSV